MKIKVLKNSNIFSKKLKSIKNSHDSKGQNKKITKIHKLLFSFALHLPKTMALCIWKKRRQKPYHPSRWKLSCLRKGEMFFGILLDITIFTSRAAARSYRGVGSSSSSSSSSSEEDICFLAIVSSFSLL